MKISNLELIVSNIMKPCEGHNIREDVRASLKHPFVEKNVIKKPLQG